MQNPSGSFSNVWRPSAPTLLQPYCAKKRPFVEQRIKSGRMGGFLQKGQAEAEAGAVSALGELPYTPKQDAYKAKPQTSSSCNDNCFDNLAGTIWSGSVLFGSISPRVTSLISVFYGFNIRPYLAIPLGVQTLDKGNLFSILIIPFHQNQPKFSPKPTQVGYPTHLPQILALIFGHMRQFLTPF